MIYSAHSIAVVCLDPRANPTDFFDLKMGGELSSAGLGSLELIHDTGCMVIRNAGGRANQSVVNDILVLDSLMGITDVVVAHHTGLSGLSSFLSDAKSY